MTFEDKGRRLTSSSMKVIEKIMLIIIVLATLSAISHEINIIIEKKRANLGDLLLLFLYLEIMNMVAVCSKSGRVPVRVPIYIAIVSIARVLIVDMKNMEDWRIISLSVSTLILAFAVILIRWGHLKLPYSDDKDGLEVSADRGKCLYNKD